MQDSAQLESSDSGSEISYRNCKVLLDVIELTLDGVGESMWHVVTLFVVSKSHGGFPFFQIVGGNTPVYRSDFRCRGYLLSLSESVPIVQPLLL